MPNIHQIRRTILSEKGFEPETIALLSRMSTTPDITRRNIINDLIKGLKDDGIWNLLDVLVINAAHSAQAGILNWINSSHTSTLVNAPTFTLNQGFTGNGSTSYIDTEYNPSTEAVNFTQNNAIFSIRRMFEMHRMNV